MTKLALIDSFEKEHGNTFSIVEEPRDNWKECECCKQQAECYLTETVEDIQYTICPGCLYTLTYGE